MPGQMPRVIWLQRQLWMISGNFHRARDRIGKPIQQMQMGAIMSYSSAELPISCSRALVCQYCLQVAAQLLSPCSPVGCVPDYRSADCSGDTLNIVGVAPTRALITVRPDAADRHRRWLKTWSPSERSNDIGPRHEKAPYVVGFSCSVVTVVVTNFVVGWRRFCASQRLHMVTGLPYRQTYASVVMITSGG